MILYVDEEAYPYRLPEGFRQDKEGCVYLRCEDATKTEEVQARRVCGCMARMAHTQQRVIVTNWKGGTWYKPIAQDQPSS